MSRRLTHQWIAQTLPLRVQQTVPLSTAMYLICLEGKPIVSRSLGHQARAPAMPHLHQADRGMHIHICPARRPPPHSSICLVTWAPVSRAGTWYRHLPLRLQRIESFSSTAQGLKCFVMAGLWRRQLINQAVLHQGFNLSLHLTASLQVRNGPSAPSFQVSLTILYSEMVCRPAQ